MRRRRQMQWAARINAALEEGRFELFRMTIQPLQSPTGAHYELLLHARRGGPHHLAGQFHRRGRALWHYAEYRRWVIENAFRWLVPTPTSASTGDVLDQSFRAEPGATTSSALVIDQFQKSASMPARLFRDHRGPPRSPGSRRPTASSRRCKELGVQIRAR
jgi:EAL domain-containing protein (putative c-di-GMP-specific phosphodiesterase class I)